MDPAKYEPLNARLSQGDIILAPVAVLGSLADLEDSEAAQGTPRPLVLGDNTGATLFLPRSGRPNRPPVVVRAWYLPALVVSADCAIAKDDEVLVAPIYPLDDADPADRAGIRAGSFVAAMSLPSDTLAYPDGQVGDWPASYVDFNEITSITGTLATEDRLVTLARQQVERLHWALTRFLVARELSTRGSLAAAEGKLIKKATVLASTSKRYSVMLTFDDDSYIVVYQEPRQDAYALESVTIKGGEFSRQTVQALTGQRLVLRFENEDHRDWHVAAKSLGLASHKVAAADTTHVEIVCPETPEAAELGNADKPQAPKLLLRVVAPAR